MSLTPLKISKILDFCKIINPEISIHRDHLIETSLVCTSYNKQINAKNMSGNLGLYEYLWPISLYISLYVQN